MDQRLSVLTIAANDLAAMRDFYENVLEWKPVAVNADIVFYQMNGFLFSIGKQADLANFIGIPPEGNGFRGVTMGYNVPAKQEVWDWYEKLKNKTVKVLQEPTEPPFDGLFFYFEDVEGNILEIAYNSFIPLDDKLNATGHDPIDDL